MEKDEMKEIFDVIEEKLNGLDQVTRREVLMKLLKSSAFLALLSSGGAGLLSPALAGAGERKYISATALTTPVPDRAYKLTRTHLSEGIDAAINEMMEEAIREALRDAEEVMGAEKFSPPSTDFWGDCSGNHCYGNRCEPQNCSGNSCEDGNHCGGQRCPGNRCETRNTCTQGCDRRHTCPNNSRLRSWINPKDLLDRYGDQPFVRELKELFGGNVLQEIEEMIQKGTSLRGRGLVDPGAPPPPSTPTLDTLRDLPRARMPQPLGQPGVQPPTAPTAPTAPPTVTPTAPPPAAAPPTGPAPGAPPVHKPPAVVPTPVVPAPVTPIAPTPITPPKPIP